MDIKSRQVPRGLVLDIKEVAGSIRRFQRTSGEIPWCDGEKTDPWDMVEAAIGLTIAGYESDALRAFDWLADCQLDDGSWYAAYRDGQPEDCTRDTNMSTYIAVGLYYYYRVTGDRGALERYWKTLYSAIAFALELQAPGGSIYWAKSPEGEVDPMSLLTGSSSIYLSLKCAIMIADLLEKPQSRWEIALKQLGGSLRERPHLYNIAKSRFSMDWFYPILSGAFTGEAAQKRVEKYWKKFVYDGQGVRCVSDEPWITIAESSEFVLALFAMGNDELARIVFDWIQDRRYEDGSYWCGYTYPEMVIWPEERLTWTNAVVLMAADALYRLTPAWDFFSHTVWQQSRIGHLL
ncbi:MAG: phenyltransferase domain-containing protein [Deltaproteobacteria bacterium]|nr:MAG: phenyltransferase domain-containing protein [Deltaproteobacteria bacterium]